MIYICYGITKSASTFLYQLTEEVFRAAGRPIARLAPPFTRPGALENYFNVIDDELLARIDQDTGGADIVLKTHGPPQGRVAELIASGNVLASASIRDPREIALSMIDHGARARRWRSTPFSEFVTLTDTLNALDIQLPFFEAWAAIDRVAVIFYNEICYDTATVIANIADQLKVEVESDQVMARFQDKRLIGQFSKGKALRYTELNDDEQAIFLKRYEAIYAAWSFDTDKARSVAAEQASQALRPAGEIMQHLTYLRRRYLMWRQGRDVLRQPRRRS
ncbi:hypothetical protein [Bosea sp. (in: a-proteobacteria)]|uniref:hypothetical protein n=1 Tax=Bosea sp. (in: a-proteobacteria) TaxID=1871050 RepID=UPI003F6ED24E